MLFWFSRTLTGNSRLSTSNVKDRCWSLNACMHSADNLEECRVSHRESEQEKTARSHSLARAPSNQIEPIIRHIGFYRQKAKRIINPSKVLVTKYDGSLNKFFSGPQEQIRRELLSLEGIGPETADSILLYVACMRYVLTLSCTIPIPFWIIMKLRSLSCLTIAYVSWGWRRIDTLRRWWRWPWKVRWIRNMTVWTLPGGFLGLFQKSGLLDMYLPCPSAHS